MTIALQRVRLRFSRSGPGAQLTHLHHIESIRRALEKSGWPVARTQAKKPKLKLSFGPAISVGYASEAEYCDAELVSRLDPSKAKAEIDPHLAPGYAAVSIKSIPRFFPSLDETLNIAAYEIRSPLLTGTRGRWDEFWARNNFVVIKKKADKEEAIDARTCVRSWELDGDRLSMLLRFGPGRTLKPERVIKEVCGFDESVLLMGQPDSPLGIKRVQLYMEKQNGELVEP